MEQEILTVSALTFAIKKELEKKFTTVCVQGEISNFKEQSSGHLYFTLKDAQAQISAVLFRGNAQALTRMPKAGDQVIVKGEISLYAPRGGYQIVVRELSFVGVGALLLKLHELKAQLQQRGWFDPRLKKPLPKFPKTIGVVTSPTGSVIQDILNILNRRYSGFQLLLNPVKVQGEGAAQEIAQAIGDFNRYRLADVLIVGRGGGSLEDLWPFNEERVAAAIHASEIPVISAVGHETDFCIADFVADVRAPTPSAAAEMVIAEKSKELEKLHQWKKRAAQTCTLQLAKHKQKLMGVSRHPFLVRPHALIEKFAQMVDEAKEDLGLSLKRKAEERRVRLSGLERQLRAQSPQTHLTLLKQKLKSLTAHLQGIHPHNLLTKGYAIAFEEKSASVILSSKQVKANDSLRLLFKDGTVHTTVREVK